MLKRQVEVAGHIQENVRLALREDIGSGDLTAALIPAKARASARLIAREAAVLCGRDWFDTTFTAVDERVDIVWLVEEGADMIPDQTICTLQGPARGILSAERTAINFLQTLSGTATVSRLYARQLEGLDTRVLDTRKTIPGLRLAQKYAARVGGAVNHRVGLYDGVLIKENHIRAAGSISQALEQARRNASKDILLEVEVEDVDELRQALDAGARRVLLDNFSEEMLREAVNLRPVGVEFEASGNVTLETLRSIAKTGVDYISVGALTKHLHAVDFSLQFNLHSENNGE